MDWKLLATTFTTVFLAEIGDKTQLLTLSWAASSRSRWIVFLGSAMALVATSAIAVLVGDSIGRWVPMLWLKRAAGVLFVVLGIWLVLGAGRGEG